MKTIVLSIFICEFLLLSSLVHSQGTQVTDIDGEFPNCYSHTYFIYDDYDGGYNGAMFWDKATDNDAQGYSPFHGGSNQQWYVMPTYPGSDTVLFLNLKDGKILDRSLGVSPGNIHCYSGKHTGNINQKFLMRKFHDLSYAVECAGTNKIIDRSLSSNTLYANSPHYGENQLFHLESYQPFDGHENLGTYHRTDGIPMPPQPDSYEDVGNWGVFSYTLMGETIIPFPYVYDPSKSESWKAQYSPYYRLKRYEYYKLIESVPVGAQLTYTIKKTTKTGVSETENNSLQTTLGIKLTQEGDISFDIKDMFGLNIGLNLEANMGRVKSSAFEVSHTEETINEVSFEKNLPIDTRIFIYQLHEYYELYRLKEITPFKNWTLASKRGMQYLTNPHSDVSESVLKNGGIYLTTARQHESQDLVPRMFSNTSPSGIASASSSYSSYYYPWKAFDGEDESGSWSRWISIPTGTFNGQWLSYEFSEPVTIMAYGITPETGTHISRSPQDWKVQAWNGSSWITMDTRTGYTTSSWQDSNSQKFTVKYPKKYNKYRLYVEKVNGSDVVSIRKFKIFGLQNDGTVKSGKSSGSLPFEITKSTPSSEIKISPNPNKGAFTVDLINVEESLEIEPIKIDSLSIVNELRKGLSFKEITTPPIAVIEIYNPMGQKIFSSETKERKVEVKIDDPKHGIYIVKAILTNKKIITEKIMIE